MGTGQGKVTWEKGSGKGRGGGKRVGGDRTGEGMDRGRYNGKKGVERVGKVGKEWVGRGQGKV